MRSYRGYKAERRDGRSVSFHTLHCGNQERVLGLRQLAPQSSKGQGCNPIAGLKAGPLFIRSGLQAGDRGIGVPSAQQFCNPL